MLQTIAVFCGSHLGRNPHFQSAAQELGQLIASQGRTLLYGGSDRGYMGSVSTAALDGGARVTGIIPDLFSDDVIYSQPRAEIVLVSSIQERKTRLLDLSDAFIALPGGVGTLDELSEVLMSNQLGLCCKPMGLLNIDGYFDPLLQQMKNMLDEELLCPGTESTILADSTPAGLLAQIDAFRPNPDYDSLTSFRRS